MTQSDSPPIQMTIVKWQYLWDADQPHQVASWLGYLLTGDDNIKPLFGRILKIKGGPWLAKAVKRSIEMTQNAVVYPGDETPVTRTEAGWLCKMAKYSMTDREWFFARKGRWP